VSEAQTKAVAEKATLYINKGLGEPWAAGSHWAATLACLCPLTPLVPCRAWLQNQKCIVAVSNRIFGIAPCIGHRSCPYLPRLLSYHATAFVNRLAGGRDPTLTFSVATSLYLVGKLSGLLSILGLAYALVVAAFTLPKVRSASLVWGRVQAWLAPCLLVVCHWSRCCDGRCPPCTDM
jgi:hypothetical protein